MANRKISTKFLSLVIGVLFIVYASLYFPSIARDPEFNINNNITTVQFNFPNQSNRCPGVLSHMTAGVWKVRPVSPSDQQELTAFLNFSRGWFKIPPNYERADKKCGNVTFGHKWIRAVCNPKGPTPCCKHGRCVGASMEQCLCHDCYDLRKEQFADHSTWIPLDVRCKMKEFSPPEACSLLAGSTITFAGDSIVRNGYTAFVNLVSGNFKDGALDLRNAEEKLRQCHYMNMFMGKVCRFFLVPNIRLCNETVEIRLAYSTQNIREYKITKRQIDVMKNRKSLLVAGIGVHAAFDPGVVISGYVKRIVADIGQRRWPKFLWVNAQAQGVFKFERGSQTTEKIQTFNTKMEKYLREANISVFNTFSLTHGMGSYDGEHFGQGMSVTKSYLLLNYLQELRVAGEW